MMRSGETCQRDLLVSVENKELEMSLVILIGQFKRGIKKVSEISGSHTAIM